MGSTHNDGCGCEWCLRRLSIAEELYNTYNEQGLNPWQAWNGAPVPRWNENSNAQVRAKWLAVAAKAIEKGMR